MEFHPLPAGVDPTSPSSTPSDLNTVIPTAHPHATVPLDRSHLTLKWFTQKQLDEYDQTGVLVLKSEDVWTDAEKTALIDGVNEMDGWPDKAFYWMKYYEKPQPGKEKPLIQRIENFSQYNKPLDQIMNGEKLLGMLTEILGEQAVLYKEKINYKLPGGEGFAPHQDVAAGWWMYGQSLHISVLVCIDEATIANGCLEIGEWTDPNPSNNTTHHRPGMLSEAWKEIPPEICEQLKWRHLPTKPGDVIFFDSYVPHRSAPNHTETKRRVLYATYAKLSEGDFRDRYYKDKRLSFPPEIERDPTKTYAYKI